MQKYVILKLESACSPTYQPKQKISIINEICSNTSCMKSLFIMKWEMRDLSSLSIGILKV